MFWGRATVIAFMRTIVRLVIIKKTSRKKIVSIIGMISIRARFISRGGNFIVYFYRRYGARRVGRFGRGGDHHGAGVGLLDQVERALELVQVLVFVAVDDDGDGRVHR